MDPTQIPLRDLHLPQFIGTWPLAPGWWVLIGLLLLLFAYLSRESYRKWRHNAPRRLALRELNRVRGEYDRGVDKVTLGKELSELLRRAMLAYAPRRQVAGLTGDSWLEWLDRGLDEQLFSKGPGRILESLPYLSREQQDREFDIDELTDAVRQRLRTPVPEENL
jgi:hypothetical protein